MLKFVKGFALLAVFTALGFPRFSYSEDPAPSLAARTVESNLSTADATIDRMYVSRAFETQHPKVVAGADILEIELKAMADFVAAGPAPGKEMILTRYGVNDDRVFDVLIEAVRKGIPVTFITDLNRALKFNPSLTPEKYTVDFSKAEFLTGDMGPGLKRLLANGFVYNEGKFRIVSQPLFSTSNNEMIPIMHEKGLLLKSSETSSRLFRGTANMTSSPRYNRTFEHSDPQFNQIYYDHYRNLANVFKGGGRIKDMPAEPPVRMVFRDKSSLEVAFTNGRFNPNDRITQVLKAATLSPETIHVEEIVMSQFAFTNKDFVNAFDVYLKEMKRRGLSYPDLILLADAQFSLLDGYGKSAVIAGYDTVPEMGGAYRGYDDEFLGKFKIYMYQRAALDPVTLKPIPELVRNGAPTGRDLIHDKSTSIRTTEYGVSRGYFYSGSLNFSGHFDNAEDQVAYTLKSDSWLMSEYKSSVVDFIRRNPEFAVSFDVGQIRLAIADVTGHTDLEVPVRFAKRVRTALRKGDASGIAKTLREVALLPSNLSARPTAEAMELGIQRVEGFMNWYFKRDGGILLDPKSSLKRLRRFASLIPEIAKFEKNGWEFVRQLNRLTWIPNAPLAITGLNVQQQAANEVWEAMKLPGKAPTVGDLSAAGMKYSMYTKASWNEKPVVFVFDLDDNLLFMPTKITVFRKQGTHSALPEAREISTSQFALIREHIGQSGEFKDYEISRTAEKNSYERFSAGTRENRNFMLEDVKSMVEDGSWESRKGPAWVAFEYALKSKESADNVYIATARSHDSREVYEVFQYLISQGKMKNIVPLENIHCVGKAEDPSGRKAEIFVDLLTELESKKVSPKWADVISPDGQTTGKFHIWTFSDDDWGNYVKARDTISSQLKRGRFQNTKVMLFYTGMNHAEHPPEAIVLGSNGIPRRILPDEEQNVAKMLMIDGKDCSDLLRYNPNLPAKSASIERGAPAFVSVAGILIPYRKRERTVGRRPASLPFNVAPH